MGALHLEADPGRRLGEKRTWETGTIATKSSSPVPGKSLDQRRRLEGVAVTVGRRGSLMPPAVELPHAAMGSGPPPPPAASVPRRLEPCRQNAMVEPHLHSARRCCSRHPRRVLPMPRAGAVVTSRQLERWRGRAGPSDACWHFLARPNRRGGPMGTVSLAVTSARVGLSRPTRWKKRLRTCGWSLTREGGRCGTSAGRETDEGHVAHRR